MCKLEQKKTKECIDFQKSNKECKENRARGRVLVVVVVVVVVIHLLERFHVM